MVPFVWVPLEISIFDLAYEIQARKQCSQKTGSEGRNDGRGKQYGQSQWSYQALKETKPRCTRDVLCGASMLTSSPVMGAGRAQIAGSGVLCTPRSVQSEYGTDIHNGH